MYRRLILFVIVAFVIIIDPVVIHANEEKNSSSDGYHLEETNSTDTYKNEGDSKNPDEFSATEKVDFKKEEQETLDNVEDSSEKTDELSTTEEVDSTIEEQTNKQSEEDSIDQSEQEMIDSNDEKPDVVEENSSLGESDTSNEEEDKADIIQEKSSNQQKATFNSSGKSVEEWYEDGLSAPTASGKVATFVDALNQYPKNQKLIEGLNESVANLVDWASHQHLNGNYSTALDRYNYIISLNEVETNFIEKVTWKKGFAEKNQDYPRPNQLYEQAILERTASGRLSAFINAHKLFPDNADLIEGVQSSAELLLIWSFNKHSSGDFETAIDRYQTILNAPKLPTSLKSRTESLLKVAQNFNRPSEVIYEEALHESSASNKLTLYMEGYEAYPEDRRFTRGIQESADSLLRWARIQHQSGDFSTAINRYNRLLQTPTIDELLKESAKKHLQQAQKKQSVPTINLLLSEINKQTTVSSIFTKATEARIWYPENRVFINELNSAAGNLLDWAKRQHERGNYQTAIDRYDRIIESLEINQEIAMKAKSFKEDAQAKKRTANTIYNEALKESRASYKLNLFIEGYQFYPNDSRFSKGIRESAESLFNWAVDKHHNGEFGTAIVRYENIINAPTLTNTELLKSVNAKLADAKIGKRPADVIYKLIQQGTTATALFDLNSEGYIHYPKDSRFINGLKRSAENLNSLAIRYHKNGNFSGAYSRYEKLGSTKGVPSINQQVGQLLSVFAKENKPVPSAGQIVELANQESTVSGIFNKYVVGYYLYSNNKQIIDGMTSSSLKYYDYAYNVHDNGDYSNAIARYENLMSTPGIPKRILDVVSQNLKRAKENKAPENQFIDFTEYNLNLEEALNIQMGVTPQTDKYRNSPAYVSSSHIEIFEGGSISSTGRVNLRTSPRLENDSNVYMSVNNGTPLIVLDNNVQGDETSGSTRWYKIEYNSRELYVHSSLAKVNSKIGRLTANANIRSASNPSSHIYGTARKGSEFVILSEGNNWHRINYNETWRNATRSDVMEYLDPTKYLNDDKQVFQFLDLSKSSNVISSTLDNFLKSKGILRGMGQAFIDAGNNNGINDLYLVSHALLETGNGTSELATGVQYNGVTVYNMFGIGAVDACPLECGARRAYEEGWTTPEKAIIGGAQFIGNDYIKVGQNTLYKMRWNPLAMERGNASHQYATDIGWAYKQINSLYNLHQEMGAFALILEVPVYK